MKILHIITDLPVEGAQMVLFQLIKGLDKQRFQCIVISLMDLGPMGEKIEQLNIPVHAIGMLKRKPTISKLNRFVNILKSIDKPDIIQGWDYHSNFASILAGLLIRVHPQVIWGIHHTPYDLKRERFLTSILIRLGAYFSRWSCRIVYVSNTSKNRHENLGYQSKSGMVISNGFNLSRFKPDPEAYSSIRSELNIEQDVLLVGSIARFHPMKDHLNFIEAARLTAQNLDKVHFILAGKQIDIENSVITEQIKQRGLSTRIHLLGERRDPQRLFAAMDVFTITSAWGESFPMVLGEAMAVGVPCVVTDIGDSAKIVGETGLVVPPQDALALANAWEHLLRLSPQARGELGAAARRRVEENYTLRGMVRSYENLYMEMDTAKP